MGKLNLRKKWISWILILSMLIPILPDGVDKVKAESNTFNGPTISSDGKVTFRYNGVVDDANGQFVVVRGAFNNWTNVKMDKVSDQTWEKTLDVPTSGIYEYGMAVVTDEASQDGWVGDPNNTTVGGNAAIVRNPQVNSMDGTAKIYYYPTTIDDTATLYYRLTGSEDVYKSIAMTKDSKYTAIYSALVKDTAGDYEYYIEANGSNIGDPNTASATFTLPTVDTSLVADKFVNQPGGNTTWRITGSLGDLDNWNVSNENTVMKHIVGNYYALSVILPKGDYQFKFTKNGSWDNSVGRKSDGENFSFSLTAPTKVNFYINDDLGNDGDFYNKFRTNLDSLGAQGVNQYTPVKSQSEWPRLVGSLQEAIGDGAGVSWSPADAKQMFVDYNFNNTVYKLQRTIEKGKYECKVVFADSWNGSDYATETGNLVLNILDNSADVTFTTDITAEKKVLEHNYKPVDSIYDGLIKGSKLYFNSRETTYKKPFGAIKQGQEDVTFRFATESNDASLVKLELIDGDGLSKTYNMSVTTVLDGKDYWEVTVPKVEFDQIGVWGYKFIVIDGATKVEYGDDGVSGGTGSYSEEGQTPYNLTVYAADYKTPDWMKNAVVYQIFPDRFFDGDTTNNRAKEKDGYRGIEKADGTIVSNPLQYFDGLEGSVGVWLDYPENPRQSEEANKPYYPDATTDGQWSNEFYGGDIAGVQQKLSYLKNLGVTAIYLNPVSWAASNHKYDATDYKHLDPMFGKPVYNTPGDASSGLNYEATREASDKVYQAFAKACNNLGINLISDGVFNHTGDDSIYFDRYEKYPEIGAYEYWSRVWDEVEKTIPLSYEAAKSKYQSEAEYNTAFDTAKSQAETKVRDDYKSKLNAATGKNYTDEDFCYINWFKVGPGKVADEVTGLDRYDYEGWWGYDSLPVVTAVEADSTNLTNDENATIAGEHEYNNVNYRENVIGYDLSGKSDAEANEAMQNANSQRWLWMGASGWRLDVAPDVSNDTWKQFRKAVKSAEGRTDANGNQIDEPVILGEEWGVATHYLLGDMFDSVMNYQFRGALQDFIVNDADAKDFNNALEVIRENYPKEAWQAMLNLVDSHDTVRNITKIDNPTWEEENIKIAPEASERAMKLQALTAIFQMSYPGAPTIYYGDEVGVTGTKDPDSRRTFPWDRVTENQDGTYTADEKYADLFNAYVKASEVRNTYQDIFATGDIKTAYAEGSVIAYARKGNTKGGLSILNKSDKAITITADVTDFLPDGLALKDQLGTNIEASVADGKVTIEVPAFTGMMMVSTSELTALPVAPSNLTAIGSEGKTASVNLTWDAVAGATGYHVYRALLDGMQTVKLTDTPITDTTFVDTTVQNGTRYYYYVKTVVDSATSVYSECATALPSYKIETISTPTALSSMNIGVGNKTGDTDVTITIPGLTDNDTYLGKEVPGLSITLVYYTGDPSTAKETKLRYKADTTGAGGTVDSKTYSASFEPTEAGTYYYYAKASVNNGYSFVISEKAQVEALASATDTEAPTAPKLEQSLQESNRVTLNWTEADTDVAGFDIYRKDASGMEVKIDTLDSSKLSYVDYTVSNDTNYTYRVAAFDASYNRTFSDEMSITPKLTMVDVTVRLNIPNKVFTSATDNIYIASNVNGWNAAGWLMKKPSGATDNNVVEYTFKMMAGKSMQYKYTRGSWATEALTSTNANDVTAPGNYGYSSTDTNISVTIKNQGGNKMLIEDNVLRWVDMPMMITVPRISYNGETIEYSTTDSSFNLQASVPFGGIFTVNGVDINTIKEGALDSYGNVRLDNIPLKDGLNTFVLHIEPTNETKAKEWLTDTGRIATQMSATTTLKITRTSDAGTPTDAPTPSDKPVVTPTPTTTSSPTPTPTVKPTPTPATEPEVAGSNGTKGWVAINKDMKEKIAEQKEAEKENNVTAPAVIVVNMNSSTVLPVSTLKLLKNNNIILKLNFEDYSWTINGKTVTSIDKNVKDYDLEVMTASSATSSKLNNAVKSLIKAKKVNKLTQVKQIELAHNGKFPFTAALQMNLGKTYKNSYIFLNYYNEKTKKLEAMGYSKSDKVGNITLFFHHASAYTLTLQNILLPTVNKTKTVYVNKTSTLKVYNLFSNDKVNFSSSKKSVATINSTGKITAKKAGTTTITTKVVQAGKTYTFTTKVTVK